MGLSLLIGFFLFRPFLLEIIIAAMVASVSFSLYEKLAKRLGNRKKLSATIISFAVLLLIILPMIQLVIYAAKQAPAAYASLHETVMNFDIGIIERLDIPALNEESIKKSIADLANWGTSWLVDAATGIVINTGNFLFSLIIVLLSVFYFLLNGPKIKEKILKFSPLPIRYNLSIIGSFREICRTTLLSLFVCALVQGSLSALGFLVIGWPFFLIFIISAFLSIIPYALGLFYLPIIAYLVATGQIWQAILVIVWNLIIVVNSDELVRAYISKGKTDINMAFMLFSILGGIAVFGFWGIFIGPLVLALTMSVLDVYGEEFSTQLDKRK